MEINKESPIDVDANETENEKMQIEFENFSEGEGRMKETNEKASWAEICDSDEDKSNSVASSDDAMLYEEITGPKSKKYQKKKFLTKEKVRPKKRKQPCQSKEKF